MTDELESIAERYERRKSIPVDRYSRFSPAVNSMSQERQRAMVDLLRSQGIGGMENLRILEIGCGGGGNLLELLLLGAIPENICANELLPARIAVAQRMLPQGVQLFPGDATKLTFDEGSFDIVYQSTVFSSILDPELQKALAESMWRWVRPGGGVLWYDFTFNNPRNPDVRGVPVRKIKELFPTADLNLRRVTLAPPIARALSRIHPGLYGVCNATPLLRTHVLCYLKKR